MYPGQVEKMREQARDERGMASTTSMTRSLHFDNASSLYLTSTNSHQMQTDTANNPAGVTPIKGSARETCTVGSEKCSARGAAPLRLAASQQKEPTGS